MMRNEYETVATIQATPEAVWAVLTDAAGYASWNPELIAVRGVFANGERLRVRVKVPGGAVRAMTLRVSNVAPPWSMEWTGGMPFGLFVGRRTLSLAPCPGGVEFRMHLSMTGLLAPMILKSLGDRQQEVDSFSAALKARVEGRTASS